MLSDTGLLSDDIGTSISISNTSQIDSKIVPIVFFSDFLSSEVFKTQKKATSSPEKNVYKMYTFYGQ